MPRDTRSSVAGYWVEAVRAGFSGPEEWREWVISEMPDPPPWLLEMACARDLRGLITALDNGGRLDGEDEGALLGFAWLSHELRGRSAVLGAPGQDELEAHERAAETFAGLTSLARRRWGLLQGVLRPGGERPI